MQFVTFQECNLSCFRNATKIPCLLKVVYSKFIVLSAVVALAVSLLRQQNGDGSEKERARSLAQKRKEDRERKCSHNVVKSPSRTMSTRESSSA